MFNIVRDTLRDVGYDPKGYQIDCYIHDQSPDIAGAVEPELAEGEDEDTLGAGDQGVMVGYACSETPEYLPMPVVAAQRLVTLLEISRMTGVIPDIGPDGKVQVTMEYNGDTPVRITTVVVSVQHKVQLELLSGEGRKKAIGAVVIYNAVTIRGISVVENSKKNPFVKMPRAPKGARTKHSDIAYPINRAAREMLYSAVLQEYDRLRSEEELRRQETKLQIS